MRRPSTRSARIGDVHPAFARRVPTRVLRFAVAVREVPLHGRALGARALNALPKRIMYSTRLSLASLVLVAACHAEPKPTGVALPESSASSVGSVSGASPALAPRAAPADLVIEARRITLHGVDVLALPADRSAGADPKDKRSGKNDLYLVPLAAAVDPDAGANRSMLVDADDTTPYRLLIEVLFTLGQREVSHWELRRRGSADAIPFDAPRLDPGAALHVSPLALLVQHDGIALKLNGTNIGTQCALVGGGLAVPKRDDAHDLPALAACLRGVKPPGQPSDAIILSAEGATPFSELWPIFVVVRGERAELFPKIQFALAR